MGLIAQALRGSTLTASPGSALQLGLQVAADRNQAVTPGGFLGNLAMDAEDIVLGLGQLVGAGAGDIGRGALELATLGHADTGGFVTPKIASNLIPAIIEDVKTRYGPLLHGDFSPLYQHPGFALADAFAVAGGVSKAAEIAAQGGKLAGVIPIAAGAATKEGFEALRALEAARSAASTGQLVSEGAARLPELAAAAEKAGPMARFANRILPREYTVLENMTTPPTGSIMEQVDAAKVSRVTESRNPLTRAITRPVREKLLGTSVPEVEARVGALQAKAAAGLASPFELQEITRLQDLADLGRTFNARVIETPLGTKFRQTRVLDHIVGRQKAEFLRKREGALHGLVQATREILNTPAEETFHSVLEGIADDSLHLLDDADLESRVRAKGYSDLSTAAVDAFTNPASPLDVDERISIANKLRNGELAVPDAFAYVPDEALKASAQRTTFLGQLDRAAKQVGIPDEQVQLGTVFFDSMAKSVAKNTGRTIDDVYSSLEVQFKDRLVQGTTELYQRVRTTNTWKRWVKLARKAEDSRTWYERSRATLQQLAADFMGETKLIDGTVVNDYDLFNQLVAATSPRRAPVDNLPDALEIIEAYKKSQLLGGDWKDFMPTAATTGYPKEIMPSVLGMVDDILSGSRKIGELPAEAQRRLLRAGHTVEDVVPTSMEHWADLYAEVAPESAQMRQKVFSFWNNLKGDGQRVTVDTWMARVLGFSDNFTPGEYRQMEGMVRRVTDLINEELAAEGKTYQWSPMQTQAALWVAYKEEFAGLLSTGAKKLREAAGQLEIGDTATAQRIVDSIRGLDVGELEVKSLRKTAADWERQTRQALDARDYSEIAKLERSSEILQRLDGMHSTLEQRVLGEVKGSFRVTPDQRGVITFLKTGDFTTLVHEGGHALRWLLPEDDVAALERHYMPEQFGIVETAGRQGGMSVKILSGEQPTTGFMVARRGYTKIVPIAEFIDDPAAGVQHMIQYLREHADLLEQGDSHLGLWVDEANGEVVFDIADNVATEADAVRLGIENNQQAIWDVAGEREIPTGGTGDRETAGVREGVGAPEDVAAAAPGLPGQPAGRAWTRDAEERFAADVERYLLEGAAPRESVAPLFQRLRDSLAELWNRVRGWTDQENLINPEVRQVLDKYLGEVKERLAPEYADMIEAGASSVPRRIRELPVASLTDAVGVAARDVPQMQGLTADGLRATAQQLERPIRKRLLDVFGRGAVESRVKSGARLVELRAAGIATEGLTDLLGYRVILGNWQEAPEALAKLEQAGLQVLGVDDFRGIPRPDGFRGVVAKVTDAQQPGFVFEAEFGTSEFKVARDATSASSNRLTEIEASIKTAKDAEEAAGLELAAEKGRRYLQGLWEPIADEIDAQVTGRAIPGGAERRALNATRFWVERELVSPLVSSGIMDLDGLFDRTYLPIRLKSGAHWDADAMDFVGGKTALEADTERAVLGKAAPVYFPHIDGTKARPMDFLLGTTNVGMRKMAKPGFLEKDRGYLFESGEFVTDPLNAYSRRAARALKWRDTLDLVKKVANEFGRRINSTDELSAGERVFAPDGLLRFFNANIGIGDGYLKRLGEIADLEDPDALRAAVEEVLAAEQRHIIGVSRKGLEMYAIPETVAKRLEAQILPKFGVKARLFFDSPTAVWRSFVLSGSPRWVVNNVLGNILFLKMQGGRITDVLRQLKIGNWELDPEFRSLMEELTPDVFESGFMSVEQQYQARLGTAANTATGRVYEQIGESRVAKRLTKMGDFTKKVNAGVEYAFRRASYLKAAERQLIAADVRRTAGLFWTSKKALEQIVDDGLTEARAEKALSEAAYFMNDYGAMTPFERQVLRRFVVPFWSFYRHVLRLSATFPFQYSGRFAVLRQLALVGRDMQKDLGPLPPWLETAIPFGNGTFLSTRGSNPFSVLTDTAESALNLTHPVWKMLYERSTGRSAFTGQQFTDANVVTPFGSEQQYRVDPDTGTVTPVDKVTPGLGEQLLQQFPQYTLAKQLIGGGASYDTATLTSILTGKGVIRDPATGEPKYPYNAFQKLAGFAGFPTFPFDLDAYQQRVAEEQNAAFKSYLSRLDPVAAAQLQIAAAQAAVR